MKRISLIIILPGCTENPPQNNIQNHIVGFWVNEKIIDNITYKIFYEFFSNLSFDNGVWDPDSSSYTIYSRGTYEIKNEEYLFLTTPGVNIKWDVIVMKYSISENGNELRLYAGDDISYEAFIREA